MKKILFFFAITASVLVALNLTAETVLTNEFWICNSPATANLGTLNNPYDGSTQAKFDAIMNSIPPNSTVHILAGIYESGGSGGASEWRAQSGEKILGSGRDNTIIQLAPGAPGLCVIADGVYCDSVVTNVEVADLTCDCNWQGSRAYTGIDLNGTGIIIRRVKVIHCGTDSHEVWGISLNNNGPMALASSQGNIIEDCEVSEFAGGSAITAIGVGGGIGYNWNGIIRDNVVLLPPDPTVASQGINGSWISGAVIDGNYVSGALNGIYSDTGGWTNTVIINNTLRNCFYGVTIAPNNNPLKNLTIAFNKIDLPATNNFVPVAFNFWNGVWTNICIFGNTVDFGNPGPSSGYLIAANAITGLTFKNNFVDAALVSNQLTEAGVRYTNVVNVSMDDNYDLLGNYLYDLNMPTVGGVPVSPFGLSLITSPESSSALTDLGLPGNLGAVVTNNETGVTLNGTFSGDGSGLTNIPVSNQSFYIRAGTTNITGAGTTFVRFSTPVPDTNYAVTFGFGSTGGSMTNIWYNSKTTSGFQIQEGRTSQKNLVIDYIAVQKQ